MNMHCIGRSLSITFLDLIMLIIKIILYGVIGVWRCFLLPCFVGKTVCVVTTLIVFCTNMLKTQSPVSLFNLLACAHLTVSILRNLLWWSHRINMLNFKTWWTYMLFVGGGWVSKKTTGYIYVTVTSEICKISLEMQVWKYCNSLISVYSPMLHKCFERVK